MAKLEQELVADPDELLDYLYRRLRGDFFLASFDDGSDWAKGDVRLAVRVYERFSGWSNTRVSLTITIIGIGSKLLLSAITSGGSQAVFFKINTLGEKKLLADFQKVLQEFPLRSGQDPR